MYNKDTINEVASVVLKILKYESPAYDPERAVHLLCGKIEDDVTDECEDARIVRAQDDSDYKFIIHLNKNKPFFRTRFSLAHELGHLFLHMGYLTDRWNTAETFQDSIYYRSYNRKDMNYSQEESEANEFAAAFLMPKEQFRQSFIRNGFNINTTAAEFQVSNDAARTRARNLGF